MHCGRPLGQEITNHKRKKVQNIDSEMYLPEYMKMESVYEYCGECLRRGYAQRAPQNCNTSAITQAKSLYLYKGAIKKTMYRLKYANKREYARFFAKQAVEHYGDWLGMTKTVDGVPIASVRNQNAPQVIVPVPMYAPKQKKRGYNQAESFAKELSILMGIPMDTTCVTRIKDTTPQKELSDRERKNNLENAFQKGKSIVEYSHILVVDDIYTTGYTAEAVARELRKQGGCHIYLLSICIGGSN